MDAKQLKIANPSGLKLVSVAIKVENGSDWITGLMGGITGTNTFTTALVRRKTYSMRLFHLCFPSYVGK